MKKFAVICHNRCGSNFLMFQLEKHPEIDCAWEIYFETEINRLKLNGPILNARQENPTAYVNYVYNKIRTNKPVVGAKLLYPTVSFEAIKKIIKEPDISFIFLYRKNLLESSISSIIAKKTNQWIIHSEENSVNLKPFLIDFKEINKELWEKNKFLSYVKKELKNHLEISYEELVNLETINKICNFLSVSPVKELQFHSKKQASEETYNLIQNRLEIEKWFGKMYGYLGKNSIEDIEKIEYWKQ